MRRIMDKLEDAAFRLRDRCKDAVQTASETFEKSKPTIQANLDHAREELGEAWEKAKPVVKDGLEKVADASQAAFGKAKPFVEECLEKRSDNADPPSEESSTEDASQTSEEDSIDLEVQMQVEKIRAAQNTPTCISEFIAEKYGRHKS